MRRQSFFQELAHSANLPAVGKRPVLQRQLQNVRLPYDVQGLFQGVGAQLQSPPHRKKGGFATIVAKCGIRFMVPPCAPPRKLGVCASKREDTAGEITISTLFELCPFFQELPRKRQSPVSCRWSGSGSPRTARSSSRAEGTGRRPAESAGRARGPGPADRARDNTERRPGAPKR